MMRAEIPAEAGNHAIANGALGEVIQAFNETSKPEALYFATSGGMRAVFAVFDLASPSDIPSIAEPFFNKLKAKVTWQPCMNMADLQAGLAKL